MSSCSVDVLDHPRSAWSDSLRRLLKYPTSFLLFFRLPSLLPLVFSTDGEQR